MMGADQLGGFVNPVQQMLLQQAQQQAQNQNQMMGQFVQTESGLVWQPSQVIGAGGDNQQNNSGLVPLAQGQSGRFAHN